MGELLFLFSFRWKEEMEEALAKERTGRERNPDFFFSRWSPCLRKDAEKIRFVWINVYGIPLHAWSTQVFRAIGNAVGSFRRFGFRNRRWENI
uniref:DUF4283 domain-containing protein n=1 Tax=Nelumbo nucifera TaxID=4432 RepID=A0A822ZFG4_NELNU|nr:TPA_asm: hypothetical protein HUJ06_016079 [Nelumbo nucifera]